MSDLERVSRRVRKLTANGEYAKAIRFMVDNPHPIFRILFKSTEFSDRSVASFPYKERVHAMYIYMAVIGAARAVDFDSFSKTEQIAISRRLPVVLIMMLNTVDSGTRSKVHLPAVRVAYQSSKLGSHSQQQFVRSLQRIKRVQG